MPYNINAKMPSSESITPSYPNHFSFPLPAATISSHPSTTTDPTKMSEAPSPTEDLSSLTAPDWPSTYTIQALAWFREFRLRISSITHRLTKPLEAALQIYEKTNSQDHKRYTDLKDAIREVQEWLEEDFITETELTKDLLLVVWVFLGGFLEMGIWNMATPREASVAVLEEMRDLRKEAREVASEARNVARVAQDVAVLLAEYKEGHAVEEMFPGFD